ncbi:GNAT family N-acetyltransferase, partial [Stenotrophomonas maltophilia]
MPVFVRDARPEDAAASIDLRGRTRANAVRAAQLAELGSSAASGAAGIAQGAARGRVAGE